MSNKVGKVSQIIGPVVDVTFDTTTTELPKIYDSLEVSKNDGSKLVLEVQSHVGEDALIASALRRARNTLQDHQRADAGFTGGALDAIATEMASTGVRGFISIPKHASKGCTTFSFKAGSERIKFASTDRVQTKGAPGPSAATPSPVATGADVGLSEPATPCW